MFVPALEIEMEEQMAGSLDMTDMLVERPQVVVALGFQLKLPQSRPKYRHPHRPRLLPVPVQPVHPILHHYCPSSMTVEAAAAFGPAAAAHRRTIAVVVVYLPVMSRTASVVVALVTRTAVKRPC